MSEVKTDKISSVSTNGDITLDPDGTGVVQVNSNLTLTTTDAGSTRGPEVKLYRNSASPADNDFTGVIGFYGENDAGEEIEYSRIRTRIVDATDGSEDSRIEFEGHKDGSSIAFCKMDSSNTVFNEDSQDIDFRVESDNKNEALFVRGSDGHVGIGTSAPTNPLYVNGDNDEGTIRVHSNLLNQANKYNGIIFSGESSHSKVGIFQVSDVLSYNKTKLVFATNTGNNSNTVTPSDARLTIANGGNVIVHGALSKGSGSFRIDHPLPAKNSTHELVHSFIEGPQADLIYRGKVDLVAGSATVDIDAAAGMTDGTFVLLCGDVQCFTSNEDGFTAVKGSVSGNTLTITAESDTCTDTISWMVVGERKDQHMIDTTWTDDNGKVIVEPLKEVIS